ncbi:aquaporin-8b [Polyodon spathula]|uniref:aquaporin-8b n=1 Tax=Polyodon spathula TaxID=7913 RepID=UPI001B7EEB56|nr:aquaporin-8b [Polyodon spathula]
MSVKGSKADLYDMSTLSIAEPEKKPDHCKASVFEKYIQTCAAEVIGSALFIFVGCSSVIENVEGTGRLQPALAHGLALAIVIAVLGEICGGHFNPAVSLSVYLIGGLNVVMLAPYIISQLCGGMLGAALAKAISTEETYTNASGGAFTAVQSSGQIGRAVVAETVMTVFLTLVVCMGAVNEKSRSHLAPLCIGLTVAADIFAGGAISGACMNPARAFGPAVVANYWSYHWIYWVGPLAGALITACFVRLLLGDRKIRVLLK